MKRRFSISSCSPTKTKINDIQQQNGQAWKLSVGFNRLPSPFTTNNQLLLIPRMLTIQRFFKCYIARRKTFRVIKILSRFRAKLLAVYRGWFLRQRILKSPLVSQCLSQALEKSHSSCSTRLDRVRQLIKLVNQPSLQTSKELNGRSQQEVKSKALLLSSKPCGKYILECFEIHIIGNPSTSRVSCPSQLSSKQSTNLSRYICSSGGPPGN